MSSLILDRPDAVTRVADLMTGFDRPWFLCGGWAVDSWLGRQTREHGDIDITVFHDDQRAIFDHLADWHLIAHDPNVPGATTEPWTGRRLDLPAHIHARPERGAGRADVVNWVMGTPGAELRDGNNLEVMLNASSEGEWILNDDPRIAVPLGECWRESPWGLPTPVPEILLFYKATAYVNEEGMKPRRRDERDFLELLPLLGSEQRRWLRVAISQIPRHEWLGQVAI